MRREEKARRFPDRASRVFAKALRVWNNDLEKALRFLTKQNKTLPHKRAPLTEVWHDGQKGLRRVLNLLGRIEHGIS